jgi:hypothetical protein
MVRQRGGQDGLFGVGWYKVSVAMQRFVEDRALFGKVTQWKSLRYISRGKKSNTQPLD